MSSGITLTAGVRQNLLSLQATADMMATTQNRLATGKKVNSALDNPTNFFTASSLSARSGDLSNLLDAMSNGIKTLEATSNGIGSITSVVENMASLVRSARADKTGAAVTPGTAYTASGTTNASDSSNTEMTFDIGSAVVNITTYSGGAALSNQAIADSINTNFMLKDSVSASVDSTGHLVMANKTTSAIAVTGAKATGVTGVVGDTITLAAGTGGGISSTRQSYMNQFNDLRTQLDALSKDASYNGINLLNGDTLKLQFNETNTSNITIQGQNADKTSFGALTSVKLGIALQTTTDFGSDSILDTLASTLQTALGTLRSQAAAYGSSLTMVQNRQTFTKSMMNTLQTGADNLVLADSNEEGANMLALQTRQQLSTTALSLANQSSQAVLKLF